MAEPQADQSKTFEFSDEDIARILMEDSLFKDNSAKDYARPSTICLEKLLERETKLYLHGVTLSDYLRVKRIPRGLRIVKSPFIGKDNVSFCDKWCEILNKCAFDLMALTVQEISAQLVNIRKETDEVKIQLSVEYPDKEQLDSALLECNQRIAELKKEIIASKKIKFNRDAADYANNRVYQWRSQRRNHSLPQLPFRGARKPSQYDDNRYSSAQSSSSLDRDSDSSYRSQSQRFLEGGGQFNISRQRKNAGGAKRVPVRSQYVTRRTIQK